MTSRTSTIETWSIEDTPDGWRLLIQPHASFVSLLSAARLGWLGVALASACSFLLLVDRVARPFVRLPLVLAVPFALLGVFLWSLYEKPPALRAWIDANEAFELRIRSDHFTYGGGVYDAHVLSSLRVVPASRPGRSRLAFDGDALPDISMLSEAGVGTQVAEQVRDAVLGRLQRGC